MFRFHWDPQVAKTFDHYHHKSMVLGYCIAYSVLVLPLSLVFLFILESPWAAVFYAVVTLLFFGPLVLHHWLCLRGIHANPGRYQCFPAEMLENHSGFARTVYLVLKVTRPSGAAFTIRSASVFSRGVLDRNYYGELFRKPLQVLYDEDSEQVLVLDPDANRR